MERLLKKAGEFLRRNKFLKRWRKALAVMMALVVFSTTYLMILPAITLETDQSEGIGIFAGKPANESVSDNSVEIDPTETPAAAPTETPAAAPTETPAVTPEDDPGQDYPDNEELIFENEFLPRTLEAKGADYTVTMNCPAEAKVPEGATLIAEEILSDNSAYENYINDAAAALDVPGKETSRVRARFFDIKIMVGEEEFEPAAPVRVDISYAKPQESAAAEKVSAVHFAEEGKKPEVVEIAEVTTDEESQEVSGVSFDADSFSVYGVVYTVDFVWEVDGKMYDFTLPGGGFVSFSALAEELELTDGDPALFAADVTIMEFSDPDLVWTGKVEADTTVGALKAANGLNVQYSAELTAEDIEEINAQTVSAGDWALISMQPFESAERLIVTMKDGEQFSVMVTDAQLSADVLTAGGETYSITVNYDEAAEIPEGTKLIAEEIEFGTDEYNVCLGQLWNEVNKKYYEVEEMREHYVESMGELPDVKRVNINYARFFDIVLFYKGKEIEPKASVLVEINYGGGLPASDKTNPGVVHYVSDNKVDIIENVETTVLKNEIISFRYEQDSFSAVGTYIGQEVQDVMTEVKSASAASASENYSQAGDELSGEALNTIVRASAKSGGALRGETPESPSSDDTSDLVKPVGSKTLTANKDANNVEDGTYTLTLSVKGHSRSYTPESKKANVLFVMDRSSSMITKTVDDNITDYWYYGINNASETTFRADISPNSGYQFYGEIDGEKVPLNAYGTNVGWGSATFYYSIDSWPYVAQYPLNAPLYVKSKTTRMIAEQIALNDLFGRLLAKNTESGDGTDNIEISLISFGDERFDDKSWSSETETGWVAGTDAAVLNAAANSNRFTSGTNWEEALQYAMDVISAKKNSETSAGKDEDYYVVFLTDGEPTAVEGESGGAHHTTDPVTHQITNGNGNIYAYGEAKDDAKALVDAGYQFYNIFTFRHGEDKTYSIYLTNYAYGNGDQNGTETSEVQEYYSDAQTQEQLVNTFYKIFQQITATIGHGNVSITDTLTTDAMTTTVVEGKTNGYVYKVTDSDGNVIYSVTAGGDIGNPAVKFNVPGSATTTYTATAADVGGKKVYSVTTDEGNTYKMALADIDDETGNLVWDLAPVGILMDDCTYSVSFVVWPAQDAYDFIAGYNNGLEEYIWDDSRATYNAEKGYWEGGAAKKLEDGTYVYYPSVVKYGENSFSVLTNTDQKIHYSVIETETVNGETGDPTITGPYYTDLPTPDPMPLTASGAQLQKKWQAERDPGILAQLLYDLQGNSKEYSIEFEVLQGTEETPYTSVSLGWSDTENKYVWETGSEQHVTYNGHDCIVGTRWISDYSIATGLMLTAARMTANGLNPAAYPSVEYGGVTYYILETGHDYTIKEPDLTYEFDFSAPTFHPMLVDGVLYNVELADNNGVITITEMEEISDGEEGVPSLVVQNTLRGYIHLEKKVVDKNDNQLLNDDTKFEYSITLNNTTDPGPFVGDSIPWYGINGLFYHDDDFNYYQAEATTTGHLKLTTESGYVCADAVCSGENLKTDGSFNPDIVGPTTVTFTDESGEEKTINLYGNEMTANSQNQAAATLKINQKEKLSLANIPVGTTYSITETQAAGYELVGIVSNYPTTISGYTVDGTIVADSDNNIIYTNRCEVLNISIQKLDGDGNGLPGAIFRLQAVNGLEESDVTGVSGLGTVSKVIDGTTETFTSAFETTDAAQILKGLPDGTYRLYEAYVPVGYITELDYIEFTITDQVMTMVTTDETLVFTEAAGNKLDLLKITNMPGAALPSTGGPGTMIFTMTGLLLVLLAGIGWLMKKKAY